MSPSVDWLSDKWLRTGNWAKGPDSPLQQLASVPGSPALGLQLHSSSSAPLSLLGIPQSVSHCSLEGESVSLSSWLILCNPIACSSTTTTPHTPPQAPLSVEFFCKNTGVGSHSLLQGIFLTQGLNPGLLHCRRMPYHLSHHRSPQCSLSLAFATFLWL